tara:strand:+ start:7560 stop:7862 length:303 start_codon:yes stop_codon:yes gene_type:complete
LAALAVAMATVVAMVGAAVTVGAADCLAGVVEATAARVADLVLAKVTREVTKGRRTTGVESGAAAAMTANATARFHRLTRACHCMPLCYRCDCGPHIHNG